jgi:hypothetical protein
LREDKKHAGGNAFAANTGFAMGPVDRIYAPDAAWVRAVRIDSLTPEQAAGFGR